MKKILVLISALALFVILLAGCGCDNGAVEVNLEIEYELNDDNTGYKVVGISSNVSETPLSEIVIPSTHEGLNVVEIESIKNASSFLSKVTLPNTIKVIREEAFSGCTKLNSINLPNSIESIEKGAFKNCSSLYSVVIPENVKVINESTFSGCSSLDEIIVHSQITEIKSYAFSDTGIESLIVPDTVLTLGEGIFYSCTSLKEASLPSHLDYIPASTFAKCKALKQVSFNQALVDRLEEASFLGCNVLRNLSLENIVKIEKDALLGCTLLTEKFDGIYYCQNWIVNIDNDQVLDRIVIMDNVKGIADGALDGGLMTDLVLPDGLILIGDGAISNLPNLKSIEIGKGLEKIGTKFLYNCKSLETIIVNEENLNFKSIDNCLYTFDQKKLIKFNTGSLQESYTVLDGALEIEKYAFAFSNLKEIILPDGILNILEGCFENCNSLLQIVIPESASMLGGKLFYGCKSLESVVIPSNITEIGYSMFVGCQSLKNVEIKGNITKIDSFAFENCTSLSQIVIPETTEHIGTCAFRGCTALKQIFIPKNVTKIDEYAFMNTKSLEEITVDSENANYVSNDGVLFTKDLNSLVQYPCKKSLTEYKIPDSVKVICGGSFAGNEMLSSITLGINTEKIESRAFSYCKEIKNIVIPSSVIYVGANAFEYSGLATINIESDEPNDNWSPYWSLYINAQIFWTK